MAKAKDDNACESAGIGGKCELVPFGGFVSITGGTREQRLSAREYGKAAHNSPPDDTPPLLDISMIRRVL